ncbi:MAG: lipase family protein, partial [Burkholderiales bacterium]
MADFSFVHDTTRYQPRNAYSLGLAADLAYEDEGKVREQTLNWGFSRFQFLDRADTQGFVGGNSEMIIVAFRGTEPDRLRDWLSDANTEFESGPFGRVHMGFQRALKKVWDDMTSAIVRFQDNAQSLWFAGHSLGAALATLAVAHMRGPPNDKPVYGLYTFGQPRVGDRDFEQRFNVDSQSRTFRFVNNNDLVTRVPSRATGFSHVGTFLYFDRNGRLVDDPGFWYRFLDGVKGTVADLGNLGPDMLKD